jgi:tryptophan synthase alpha chain
MSDRLQEAFASCRKQGRPALITYVMAGDPDLAASRAMALACIQGGADLLEIGMPFSDPIADGPTLQRAAERALAAGTTAARCLKLAAMVRKTTAIPIVLMGYLNPILAYGPERFLRDCELSGVDGLIVPDLPPEEGAPLASLARRHGVALVFLLAPTSTPARQQAVFKLASGFTYFVSVTGVTGARRALPVDLGRQLEAVRRKSPVPLVVGFGIATPAQARSLGQHADGIVVGSAIVERIAAVGPVATRAEAVRRFVATLRKAVS